MPGHSEAKTRASIVPLEPWIAGSSPAMTKKEEIQAYSSAAGRT
jgi:hypothetical protein